MINAKWITCPGHSPGKQCFFYARKEWNIEKEITAPVSIKVSADSRYRLYLNGVFVNAGPVRGSATLNFYDETDISGYLKKGHNEIFFEVYSLLAENYVFNSLVPALIAEIPGMLATDESFQVQNAECWKTDVPWYTKQSGKMEFRDLRIKPGEKWQNAVAVTDIRHLAKELRPNLLPDLNQRIFFPVNIPRCYEVSHDLPDVPHDIPPFLEDESHYPATPGRFINRDDLLTAPCGESGTVILPGERAAGMIVSFDWEISGRAELLIEAPAGTEVQIVYAETIVNNRLKTKFSMDYHFTDCFILDEGKNVLTTSFSERGFRVLQISIRKFDRPVKIRYIRGIDLRYPFSRRGSFHCSDELLNRINEVCAETISACTSDVFTDCPWRERAFWANDLLVNNLASLSCFGPGAIHRRCFELLFSQKHSSGMIPAVIPQPFYSGQPLIFAATNLYTPLILMDYLLYSGDAAEVKKYLPDVERILDAAWQLADEDGILRSSGVTARWNFFDWSFESNGYGCSGARESMLTSLFIIAVKTFEKLAAFTGYTCDEAKNLARRKLSAANLEKWFVSPENNWIVEELCTEKDSVELSTQLAHALWLLTGDASEEKIPDFTRALTSWQCLMPDFYLHYFWFRAAAVTGQEETGLNRIRKDWGRCIATGSPTLYEAGIHGFGFEAMDGSGSLCHAFGTIPVNFFQQVILGVKPLLPGFKEFTFDPKLFDLEFAEGRIPVPGGAIEVKITGNNYQISIPDGCGCRLPDNRRLPPGTFSGKLK